MGAYVGLWDGLRRQSSARTRRSAPRPARR